jgi:ADP-ribosylglycohydrolase
VRETCIHRDTSCTHDTQHTRAHANALRTHARAHTPQTGEYSINLLLWHKHLLYHEESHSLRERLSDLASSWKGRLTGSSSASSGAAEPAAQARDAEKAGADKKKGKGKGKK